MTTTPTHPVDSTSEEELGPKYEPRITPAWTLLYDDIPEPKWLIDGWVPQGKAQRIMFGGAPKAKKSTLAFELAVSLASHSDFLGLYPVNSGETYNVLYIQEENSASSMRRDIAAILNGRGMAKVERNYETAGLPPEAMVQWDSAYEEDLKKLDLMIHQQLRLNEPSHMEWLEETIIENDYSYIFLDSLYRLVPGADLDKGWQTSQVLDILDHLRVRTGTSIVVIHHAGKTRGGGSAGDKLMHSTYLRAWYDCLIFPSTQKNGDSEVLVEAREFEEPDPHYLRQEERGVWAEGQPTRSKADEKGERHERISRIYQSDAELRNHCHNGKWAEAIERLKQIVSEGPLMPDFDVRDATLRNDLKEITEADK